MDDVVEWLLKGDVSIQYLTHRMLLKSTQPVLYALQGRIQTEGYGLKFLSARNPDGHWGIWYYQPKWTCTHYTLTDLKNIGIPSSCDSCREMVLRAFDECMLEDGSINFAKAMPRIDLCINGMFLNYAAYFMPEDKRLEKLVDFILSSAKQDGGYSWDPLALDSDPHTTICVLEGFQSFMETGNPYRHQNIDAAKKEAVEYLLHNHLFMQDDKRYLKLSYPYRYRYDVLRVLEYFATAKSPYDIRMQPALDWLRSKRREDGCWYLENIHKGNIHLEMETKGRPSRFITLKALFIIDWQKGI